MTQEQKVDLILEKLSSLEERLDNTDSSLQQDSIIRINLDNYDNEIENNDNEKIDFIISMLRILLKNQDNFSNEINNINKKIITLESDLRNKRCKYK